MNEIPPLPVAPPPLPLSSLSLKLRKISIWAAAMSALFCVITEASPVLARGIGYLGGKYAIGIIFFCVMLGLCASLIAGAICAFIGLRRCGPRNTVVNVCALIQVAVIIWLIA